MKVLQIARQFYPSTAGVERFTLDLCRHLIKKGIQSDVVTLNRCFYQVGVLPEREEVEGIKVARIPFWGRQRFFIAPGVLRYVPKYDVLHVHNIDFFSDFIISTKPYHQKPVVISTHGGYFHTDRFVYFKKFYFQTITRLMLRRADCVIAVSAHDQNLFSKLVPGIKLIENGIDFGRLSEIRKEIEPGLLLYIGRLVSNKHVDHLIQCLAVVQKTIPHAKLVLVGPDYEGIKDQLRNLADQLGILKAVIFAGQVSDAELADWLSCANVFVSASAYEAFGISVLEAMSTGTVPVVNPLESFQNFIQDGVNGFFTDFSQPERTAEVIIKLLRCDVVEYVTLGENAKQSAVRFAWHNKVDQFIEVYRHVIQGVSYQ